MVCSKGTNLRGPNSLKLGKTRNGSQRCCSVKEGHVPVAKSLSADPGGAESGVHTAPHEPHLVGGGKPTTAHLWMGPQHGRGLLVHGCPQMGWAEPLGSEMALLKGDLDAVATVREPPVLAWEGQQGRPVTALPSQYCGERLAGSSFKG